MQRSSAALLAAVLSFVLAPPAAGSALSLHPTRFHLIGESSDSLILKNRGDQPILIQVRVMAWSDRAGEDLLEPSSDIVAWPPIVEVGVHGRQVIRLASTRPPSGPVEASYRLLVSEVPRGTVESAAPGVRFALQFSLPVFVHQDEVGEPALEWSLEWDGPEAILWAANNGNVHARVLGVAMRGSIEPRRVARLDEPRYVLPGARRGWRLTAETLAGLADEPSLTIEATSDTGASSAVVRVPARRTASTSSPTPQTGPGGRQ